VEVGGSWFVEAIPGKVTIKTYLKMKLKLIVKLLRMANVVECLLRSVRVQSPALDR
jgi:hypothetical protein